MNPLENPVPIWAAGAVLLTLAGLVFLSRRNARSLIAVAAVVLITAVALLVEWLVVTPREEVETAVREIVAAVASNDPAAVNALVDPTATGLRGIVEAVMPRVEVSDTKATSIEVTVTGQQAESRFRGKLDGVHVHSGQRFVYFDEVILQWTKVGDRWLLVDFTAMYRGKPVDVNRY